MTEAIDSRGRVIWFEAIPKVELHLHLEGAIPLKAFWELVRKYGGDPSVPNLAALRQKFEFADFPQFIRTWSWKSGFLREYEDFTHISEAVARTLVNQNIRHVEASISPSDFSDRGLKTQRLIEAVRTGLSKVQGVEVSLIVDLVRDDGAEKAAETLSEASETLSLGVVGVGLGGSEHRFPPEPFEAVFAAARRLGLRATAHAGEAAGAESVWGALRSLRVDRIGHGVRAAEDEDLLDYLAERGVPLEICPTSNLRTGVVRSIEEHPVRRYIERGLIVTINTDDPAMFGCSLAGEYRLLVEQLGFSRADVRNLVLQAARSSWLPEDRKLDLVEKLRNDPAWDEARGGSTPALPSSSSSRSSPRYRAAGSDRRSWIGWREGRRNPGRLRSR